MSSSSSGEESSSGSPKNRYGFGGVLVSCCLASWERRDVLQLGLCYDFKQLLIQLSTVVRCVLEPNKNSSSSTSLSCWIEKILVEIRFDLTKPSYRFEVTTDSIYTRSEE